MINVSMLEEPVISALLNAGWSQDRKTNIDNWIEELTNEGFKSFPYAIELLEEIGGLILKPERIKYGYDYPGDADFNVYDVASGEFDRLEYFEDATKEELFPLGMAYGQWLLYVAKSRKIYMGDMNKVFLLGNDFEDFINNLVMCKSYPVEIK